MQKCLGVLFILIAIAGVLLTGYSVYYYVSNSEEANTVISEQAHEDLFDDHKSPEFVESSEPLGEVLEAVDKTEETPVIEYTYWDGREMELPYVTDMYRLDELMLVNDGFLLIEQVEELLGIKSSQERYEGHESQKHLYDFKYDDGAYIQVAFFSSFTSFDLRFEFEVWGEDFLVDKSLVKQPDLSALGFTSTYKDYVETIGAKGLLFGVTGNMCKTYKWYLADRNSCEYTFDVQGGTMTAGRGFWQ